MRLEDLSIEERLATLANIDDPTVVQEALSAFRPEDIAEGFQRIDLDDALHILQLLDEETAAYVLVELPTELARRCISDLSDATVAHYLDVLPMDDALDLREELDPDRFEALLHVIPHEDALEIRRLLSYPEESAGQLMTEAFMAVDAEDTMADVLRQIRHAPEEQYETVNYVYVLDRHRHLLGVMTLKNVLRADPKALASEVMLTDIITVNTHTPDEEVARTVARYSLAAVPVLDTRGRMMGIVTADDAQDILEQADTEDVLLMGAVSGDAEAYLSLSVWELVKRRVPWLLALFVAESLTGNVLRYYGQGSDQELKMNPLTFFIPLLIGAGGNSGSQVTTTITRALALGEIRPSDWWRVTRREFATALVSGTILGTVGFFRAHLPIPVIAWGQDIYISLVVGLTLPAIVIWSTSIGSMLPIMAKRVGLDPAVMSAPFITTFVDATGLVIYFEIAHRIMQHAM